MGATDNAFIRIFDDGHTISDAGRLRSRDVKSSTRDDQVTTARSRDVKSSTRDDQVTTARSRDVKSSTRGDQVATAVPSAVSQVYAGMTESPPITLPLAIAKDGASVVETSGDGSFLVEPEPHRHRRQGAAATQGDSLRLDAGESPSRHGPHIKPSALILAAAGTVMAHNGAPKLATATLGTDADESLNEPASMREQGTEQVARVLSVISELEPTCEEPIETATLIKPAVWLPDWEVDRFRWPSVCESLSEGSTAQLSDLVRPLLADAWKGQNVIAVTSFAKDEGATTVAMCVARMAASFNVSVALLEGDEEAPSLGSSLGIAYETDWNHCETECLAEAAIGSLQDKLIVLPLCPPDEEDIKQRRSADDLARTIFELSDRFELVVVDAGPMFSAAYRWFCDPVADTIDRTLLVQDVRNTTHAQIDDVCSRLKQAGMPSVAVVENFHSADSERE